METSTQHQLEALRRNPTLNQYLLTFLLALAATLPFLNKAVHIDDVLYLMVADQILKNPLDPYHGKVLWDAPDGQPSELFTTDFNPPLWKYLLAGVIKIAGRQEWQMHLLPTCFTLLAAFGVLKVSARWTKFPLWCVAIILLGPFFLPGQNLMLEVPMLCFCIWALEFQIRCWEGGTIAWTILVGLLLSCAVLTKYTAGLFLPIFVWGAICYRSPKSLLALFFPALALAGWIAFCKYQYGHSHFGAHGFAIGQFELVTRLQSVLRIIGGVTVFGPLLTIALVRRQIGGWIMFLLCIALASAATYWDYVRLQNSILFGQNWEPTPLQRIHYVIFFWHGAYCCLALVGLTILQIFRNERNPFFLDRAGLLDGWMILLFVFNIVSVPFNAVRHLLMFFVPMTWRVADSLDVGVGHRTRIATMIVSTLLGFGLAYSDYELAGYYRKVAATEVRPLVMQGKRVWFTGNWGWLYYAAQNGGLPWVKHPEEYGFQKPAPGDVFVRPYILTWRDPEFPAGLTIRKPFVQKADLSTIPLRTLSPGTHYYSAVGNGLPWEILIVRAEKENVGIPFEFKNIDDVVFWFLERSN